MAKEVLPVRLTLFTSPEDPGVESPRRGRQFGVLCVVAVHRIPVATIERLVDLPHDLNDLL